MQDLDTPRGGQEYSSGMFCLAWYMRYPPVCAMSLAREEAVKGSELVGLAYKLSVLSCNRQVSGSACSTLLGLP
eukprot:scaffold143712_cov25-Tisochrysis_lutea.AAC.2